MLLLIGGSGLANWETEAMRKCLMHLAGLDTAAAVIAEMFILCDNN